MSNTINYYNEDINLKIGIHTAECVKKVATQK